MQGRPAQHKTRDLFRMAGGEMHGDAAAKRVTRTRLLGEPSPRAQLRPPRRTPAIPKPSGGAGVPPKPGRSRAIGVDFSGSEQGIKISVVPPPSVQSEQPGGVHAVALPE